MLDPLIVQILLGVGFLLLTSTQVYIAIHKKRSAKAARKTESASHESTQGQYRIIARVGATVGNLISLYVILNIFFLTFIRQYVPHFDLSAFTTPVQLTAFASTLFGCGIMFMAYQVLGANWIDGEQRGGHIPLPAEQELVQTGIYKYTRNPLYLASYLVFGGFVFLLLDYVLLAMFIIYMIGNYFQVLDEEKALLEHFGDQYAQYRQHTGRFFPKRKK